MGKVGKGRALFVLCLLKRKVTGAVPNLEHLSSHSLSQTVKAGPGGKGGKISLCHPSWEENIISVSSAMELSEIHGVGDRINGETRALLCSATEKFM